FLKKNQKDNFFFFLWGGVIFLYFRFFAVAVRVVGSGEMADLSINQPTKGGGCFWVFAQKAPFICRAVLTLGVFVFSGPGLGLF
ncbi:hypothetical protein, partial [Enterobacter mori]